ncbi:cellulase family glycosylhydrolase [Carboxylicivirga sediminis]|uniref:Cellulase family glycosylhydrolase n=1 Tax=Carboxylicivirga sediminis TaxID=2006564 RepID=A0A941F1G5_9BACT|nr:cellulase family glycosylhydrolase [Carboxylicivirga sediminis]MBR8534055.1 cellulase family glycosylhydrolase [Carboxylicivirga sediminis]
MMKLSVSTWLGLGIITIVLLCSCASENKSTTSNGFTTTAGRLLDANGQPFIIRGVNVPHAWFEEPSYEALRAIAAHDVNCVRIVWEATLPPAKLERIIQRCVNLKMIPMLELHDATGDTSAMKLLSLARYFTSAEMLQMLKKYERYVLVNIANEWGDHSVTGIFWSEAYQKCVSLMREAGYTSTIVIDAPGWGQNIQPIIDYGQQLVEFDSQHNLLFSIHMYGSWNDENVIERKLNEVSAADLPLVVGEFGYCFNSGDNNLGCKVNHREIMQCCEDLDMGYLAWSWTGNNAENRWLDLVEYTDWKTLTWWGKEVFYSPHGISNTAVKASVFTEE